MRSTCCISVVGAAIEGTGAGRTREVSQILVQDMYMRGRAECRTDSGFVAARGPCKTGSRSSKIARRVALLRKGSCDDQKHTKVQHGAPDAASHCRHARACRNLSAGVLLQPCRQSSGGSNGPRVSMCGFPTLFHDLVHVGTHKASIVTFSSRTRISKIACHFWPMMA